MIEKVNPQHPDKVADRIAGAIVDLAYTKSENPKIAVEVLIGHGYAKIIAETSEEISTDEVNAIVNRIVGYQMNVWFLCTHQDKHLAQNQRESIKCGDNGIFKGMPLTDEEKYISAIARGIYAKYPYDGKYILGKDGVEDTLIICQSHASTSDLQKDHPDAMVNPLGDWTGGLNVDTGCTNRKLGSDMAQSVTGGGLHGKDLSKADVSVNIYAFLLAQQYHKPVEIFCAIGDDYILCNLPEVEDKPYGEVVEIARDYIKNLGGFEKFAEWGLF